MSTAAIGASPPEIACPPGRERSSGVTTTDVLKFVGIAMVLLDHHGLYFDPDHSWWRVFGRIAAPIFFFLIGFARTRSVPWTWIVFGTILSGLELWTSWEDGDLDDGLDVYLNILLNFALLRVVVLPFVERYVLRRPVVLALFVIGCVLLIDQTDGFVEYGTSGWLWAILGLSLRIAQDGPNPSRRLICIALALVTASVYVVSETIEFEFSAVEVVVFAGLIAGLTASLLAFRRTVLRVQPPAPLALLPRFCGRYSLEIFAITLFAQQFLGHVTGLDEESDSGEDDGSDSDEDDEDDD